MMLLGDIFIPDVTPLILVIMSSGSRGKYCGKPVGIPHITYITTYFTTLSILSLDMSAYQLRSDYFLKCQRSNCGMKIFVFLDSSIATNVK